MSNKPTYEELEQRVKKLEQGAIKNKQAEEDLKEREEKYRLLAEISNDFIVIIGFDGYLTFANNAALKATGFEKSELLKTHYSDLIPEEYLGPMHENIEKRLQGKNELVSYKVEFISKNGDRIPVEVNTKLIIKDQKSSGILATGRDITERKKAEEALQKAHEELESNVELRTRELKEAVDHLLVEVKERKQAEESLLLNEEKFRTLFDNAPVLIDAFDENGLCVLWNQECEKVFGWKIEELNSHDNPLALFYPDPEVLKDGIGTIHTNPDSIFREFRPITKAGEERTVLWANFQIPNGIVINIGHDITNMKKMQNQLIRSERLAATGQLAASIAHEINSPLQAVTVMLDSIKKEYKQNEELSGNIDLLIGAFESIRDTVKNLGDLNRPGQAEIQSIKINDSIEKTIALFRNNLKKNRVKTNLELSSKVPMINASPQQLSQVWLNLLNNAIEAMSGKLKKGKLSSVTTREINIKSNLRKGSVVIRFSDSGPGISKDDLDKVFDPFYTRKKTMGLGVGLSICHDIIKDHSGTITASNSPEGGAVFTIKLPVGRT